MIDRASPLVVIRRWLSRQVGNAPVLKRTGQAKNPFRAWSKVVVAD
jgi:hypothetical protein